MSSDWLRQTLSETEAVPNGDGELDVELTKSGRDVIVRGRARLSVTMPCSRTLDPMRIELSPEIFLMLTRTAPPETTPRARVNGKGRGRRRTERGRESGNKGWNDDPILSDDAASRDLFVGEQIALDSFVREFILLELPMFPVRSDLPSDAPAAIAPPSPGTTPGSEPRRIDPRLAPLAAIKSRLKKE
jgi:uncharacterized protein